MKLIRYVYPVVGNVCIEEAGIAPVACRSITFSRFEVFNIHGDLVSITRKLKNLRLLNLQQGFYLIREKDINGRVTKSRKIVI